MTEARVRKPVGIGLLVASALIAALIAGVRILAPGDVVAVPYESTTRKIGRNLLRMMSREIEDQDVSFLVGMTLDSIRGALGEPRACESRSVQIAPCRDAFDRFYSFYHNKTMHEKFGVIADDVFNGSANMSLSSMTKHSEDRYLFRNVPILAQRFVAEFERLWQAGVAG